jgi:type IV secretory pathway VirB2 component (pilin)
VNTRVVLSLATFLAFLVLVLDGFLWLRGANSFYPTSTAIVVGVVALFFAAFSIFLVLFGRRNTKKIL